MYQGGEKMMTLLSAISNTSLISSKYRDIKGVGRRINPMLRIMFCKSRISSIIYVDISRGRKNDPALRAISYTSLVLLQYNIY